MPITDISVTNFKSFETISLQLRDLNVSVGANASGKSNFVHVFQFLRDIKQAGLQNAISMQGGVRHLRNVNIGPDHPLSIKLVRNDTLRRFLRTRGQEQVGLRITSTEYEFALQFNKRGEGFRVIDDKFSQGYEFFTVRRDGSSVVQTPAGLGSLVID